MFERLWKITALGLFFVALAVFWIFIVGVEANQPGSFYNKGNNAVWISHKWVGETQSDADIQKLVEDFKKHDIGTVFVHSGPFKGDGSIDPETYQYSIQFLEKARSFDSSIQYQAWLGQVRSKLNLADEKVRHNIVKQVQILTNMVGFDGINFDIEPVWDGDLDFIMMLDESRQVLSKGKKISVDLAEFIPRSFIWMTEKVHKFERYNTDVNYKNVAKHADQVVVMAYDTGFESEWFYKWFVKEQTIWVTRLLQGKEVFIAIPSYEDEKEGFDSKVENVKNGVLGILKGLNNLRSDVNNFAGVAIYPYWKMDEQKWQDFDNLWLK